MGDAASLTPTSPAIALLTPQGKREDHERALLFSPSPLAGEGLG